MRFTIFAMAAGQALALRPEMSRASVSRTIASIGDIVSKISSPEDSKASLASLKEVSSQVSALIQQGPVDDHIDNDDRQLLSSVISLIEKTIYSSMDDSHSADVAELAAAIKAAEACNADIALRQSAAGDLGILHAAVQQKQQELDRLQGVVDDKTEINNTKWEQFDSHMQMISDPPACPAFPSRTMPSLDVYFEKSDYVTWFAAQQASYTAVRDDFVAADGALSEAIDAYNVQKAVRDVQYCDWKSELAAACAAFDTCFKEKSDFYTNTLVPRVTSDMNSRIEVKKAGDTVVHQINFLLGAAAQQETPTIDTSRYQIDFPTLPAKGLCDLSPLDADEWVPVVTCATGVTKDLIMESGVTCSEHARDPHWGGDCGKLMNGEPGWGGGKGLHVHRTTGWVQYEFAAPKCVEEITIDQLGNWVSKSFIVQILKPGTKELQTIKSYVGDAPQNTVFDVPNECIAASGIRLASFEDMPRDSWARLRQIYIRGKDTQ